MTQQHENPLEGHPRYEKVSDVNSGSFGFVMKARDRLTGRLVAIKFLHRGDKIHRYVQREILNHKRLRHPHVVQFYEVFLTEEFLAIVMEFADQGDLFLFVQQRVRLKEDLARWIFQQLVFGLDYTHRRGVANRDVKLENVLLQSGHHLPLVKLCDFGYSKHEDWDSAPRSRVGTPDYMAPEVVRNRDGYYDAKMSDIWSCGVVLYVMLVGNYPFSQTEDNKMTEDLRQKQVLNRIVALEYRMPPDLTPECQDLIRKILVTDPRRRLTITGIMEHPWYKVGLPPNALTMNDIYLGAYDEAGLQTDDDIKRIVSESMKAHGFAGDEMNSSEFDAQYLDEVIDKELNNLGSSDAGQFS
ncbi:unnamed protein product [Ostreobium quekettii]|uniref:Protein kinase domain-containing protein n=1 Tax=Ostreobium quekettii TaxID=121088 RepID=A0A8S1JII5_9CHLO|nr:unnamed protein product [Ostreobium quekettii]|eukprot:evm.model.scf_826.2 EVM.evm.TU.scf_826.2   scf_826:43099-45910(-)